MLGINSSSGSDLGLFSFTGTGSVGENLALTNVQVSGQGYLGGLVGFTANGTGSISNTYTMGTVTGAQGNIGGLVGVSTGGVINLSYSTASVSGAGNLGRSDRLAIKAPRWPMFTGTGSAGRARRRQRGVGGLVGLNSAEPAVMVTLTVPDWSRMAAGPTMWADSWGSRTVMVSNSFWDDRHLGHFFSPSGGVGSGANSGVLAATTSQLETQSFVTGNSPASPNWDFTNVWTTYGGTSTPVFIGSAALSLPGGGGSMDTLNGTSLPLIAV